jgi:hypothetical protein
VGRLSGRAVRRQSARVIETLLWDVRQAASNQLSTEIGSGRRSSGCLETDDALAQGRDKMQQKVTRRKPRTFKNGMVGVESSFRGRGYVGTGRHLVSKSLRLSKVAPRPTW